MGGDVVAGSARHDRDVGLGLRVLTEGERCLQAWVPPWTKGRGQNLADLRDDGRMRAARWLAHDEHSVEQFQTLSDEDAEVNEALVLRSSPALRDRFLLEP